MTKRGAKIVTVVGARPQFIKLAALSRRLRARWNEVTVHTGQHYSRTMSDVLFDELQLPRPEHNLGIGSAPHGAQTGRMLSALEEVFQSEKPNLVVVFGDTNSTLAGALAASKMGLQSVHVEAGLRSFNRTMPEEINRVVADHTTEALFAPTETAMANLTREGLKERSLLTGDIMVDTLRENIDRAKASNILARLDIRAGTYVLLTLHRPYNVDDPTFIPLVIRQLIELQQPIVFPVHPRTLSVMDQREIPGSGNQVLLCDPVSYLDFMTLQHNAAAVITDSGGVQKEAYLLGVRCITVRPETEWVETVDLGWNLLANPREPGFIQRIREFAPSGDRPPIFGEHAADNMVEAIARML